MIREVGYAAALLWPVALAAAWGLARWRIGRGQMPGAAWRRSIAEVGMLWGTVPGVALTLLPGASVGAYAGGVSLAPFRDLPTMSTVQVVGNLLLFAPLGCFGPLRTAWLGSVPRVTLVAALGSTAIEVTQHELGLGRVSSVDDILLNTAGAAAAAAVALVVGRGASGVRPTQVKGPQQV